MIDLELLQKIFYAMIIVSTPVITYAVCRLLKRIRTFLSVRSENSCYDSVMIEILDAVETAVVAVNQSYVDDLKKMDVFDEACQKEAFNKAMSIVKARISETARDIIAELYGDIDGYLSVMIEAEVKACKK